MLLLLWECRGLLWMMAMMTRRRIRSEGVGRLRGWTASAMCTEGPLSLALGGLTGRDVLAGLSGRPRGAPKRLCRDEVARG